MIDRTQNADLERKLAATPLAIVGMSSLFPGSNDIRTYWNNILAKVDSIKDVPSSHWDPQDHFSTDRTAPDKTYSSRGGFIDPVPFHPIEFGIPPAQLEVTDVLQLLSLIVARDVLRDAGADEPWFDRSRTGVVLGVTGANQLTQPLSARLQTPALKRAAESMGLSAADADELAERFRAAFAPWEENSFPGMLGNVVAGRIANRFDFGGTNMTVDAACASSLAALRAAASDLVDHRADTMITGGCDAENTIFMYLCFSKTPAFSMSGNIRPFDKTADGTLIGEGIGMLALRRLEDAERDDNQIYAVIKGIGTASDGRQKSIYAPAPGGQQLAVRRAYLDADCDPSSVGLVEAHGTGTAVGDATELAALAEVLQDSGSGAEEIAVGSIKSQIGHTKAAAGAAGMIKLALALQHRTLPPTIGVSEPAGVLAGSPLHVSAEPRPWLPSPGRPVRRAGVSSFGFGGTDFHVVLEEHRRASEIGVMTDGPDVYVWAAGTVDALIRTISEAQEPLDSGNAIAPSAARVAIVATDADELERLRRVAVERLTADANTAWHDPRGVSFAPRARSGEVGVLFAGQGSQYVNPGLTAVLREPRLLDAFEEAVRTPGLESLGRVAYPPPRFDEDLRRSDEKRLRQTNNAQPVIGALSVGHFRVLQTLGLEAAGYAGHSFGELTALWAAGSIDAQSFFALAAARGSAMAAASGDDPGTMAAVVGDLGTVESLIEGLPDLEICNVNGPSQFVVGGGNAAIQSLITRGTDQGVRVVPLPVAAAFHTRYVSGARDSFGEAIAAQTIGEPIHGAVYANTPGAKYGADSSQNAATLVNQLAERVDFVSVVERMRADGVRVFVECGTGQVLSRLVPAIVGDDADVQCISMDSGDPAGADRAKAQAIAQLVVAGVLPRWSSGAQRKQPSPVESKGPAVYLSGINHVAERTATAYQELLARPYSLCTSNPQQVQEVSMTQEIQTPQTQQTDTRTVLQPVTVDDHSDIPTDGLNTAREQWRVHSEFLAHQHKVSNALLGLLQNPPQQPVDPKTLESIVSQCAAVGSTHLELNRLLCDGAQPGPVKTTLPPERSQIQAPAVSPASFQPAEASVTTVTEQNSTRSDHAVAVDLEELVFTVVSDKTGYTTDILEPTMGIEADLGIDSIKRVEILGAIGQHFPDRPPFTPEEVAELRTLGDLINALSGSSSDEPAPGVEGTDLAGKSPAAPTVAVGRAVVEWTEVPAPDVPLHKSSRRVHVASARADLGEQLAQSLTAAGHEVVDADDGPADLVVVVEPSAESVSALADAIVCIGRFVGTEQASSDQRVLAVGVVDESDPLLAGCIAPSGLAGVVRTLRIEHPHIDARAVLVDNAVRDDCAAAVVAEYDDPTLGLDTIRLTTAGRMVHRVAPDREITDPKRSSWSELTDDHVVVVTGGARGITATCAIAAAAANPAPAYVLLGRTPLSAEPDWAAGLTSSDELRTAAIAHLQSTGQTPKPRDVGYLAEQITAVREIHATLAEFARLGARAEYVVADLGDATASKVALAPWAHRIVGIIHGAGQLADRLIVEKTAEEAQRVLSTKLTGLQNVLAAVAQPKDLRHLVAFSSAAGLFGNRGQSDYAAANAALDEWVRTLGFAYPSLHAVSIDWGAWDGGMVTPALREMFAARNYPLVQPDVGARLFAQQLDAVRAGQQQVLLGPLTPLSTASPVRQPLDSSISVSTLVNSQIASEHQIAGQPTLPAAVVAGMFLGASQRHLGRKARLRDLKVDAGISTKDAQTPCALRLTPEVGGTTSATLSTLADGPGGADRPRFRADLVIVESTTPPVLDSPSWQRAVTEAKPPRSDGPLFHGNNLHAVRAVDRTDKATTVVGVRPEIEAPLESITDSYDPVLIDAALQAALVAVHEDSGAITLPSGVASISTYATVPPGRAIAVRIADVTSSDGGVHLNAVVGTRSDDGEWEVLAVLEGIQLTVRPDVAGDSVGRSA